MSGYDTKGRRGSARIDDRTEESGVLKAVKDWGRRQMIYAGLGPAGQLYSWMTRPAANPQSDAVEKRIRKLKEESKQ